MARIAGVDLPREKRIEVGIRSIYGIGPARSKQILEATGINPDTRVKDLTDDEVNLLRDYIDKNIKVEGDLRREVSLNIRAPSRMHAPARAPKSPLQARRKLLNS